MNRYGLDKILDIVCVGAGPAALGVLHAAKESGLDAVAIDKGPVCSALASHPTYMRWFSTADKLELAGFPLTTMEKNPTRQEYLKYCRTFVKFFGLNIATYCEVTEVTKAAHGFDIAAKDLFGRVYTWRARNVVMATGFYDSPRPLGIPGEDLPKVSHRYTEAHWYSNHDVLVIGAGSSAAEIALELWRNGTRVTVAMRGNKFETKYWIEPDIENRISEGSIPCYRNATVTEIRPDDVILRNGSGKDVVIPNDFVLAMTGYEPDTSLIASMNATIDTSCGKPALDAHYETDMPGLYVAGTLCAGQESNIVFIENSRDHGPAIVRRIAEKAKHQNATRN